MKLINYILLIFLATGFILKCEANTAIFDKANNAYENEDFELALNLFTELIDTFGYESENLYYNLGNTHYKLGNLGQSILYFERALKLNPNNKNIQHNLKIAESNTVDYNETLPPLFFKTWWSKIVYHKSSNQWAIFATICLWLSIISFVFWKIFINRTFLMSFSKIFVLFFGLFFFFGFYVYKNTNSKQFAIVTKTSTQAKIAPDKKSKNTFKLYEGYKVKIIDEIENWSEIMLPDGKKSWIESEAIEII